MLTSVAQRLSESTYPPHQPMQPYQPHRISRSRLIVGLMIMAMLASCTAPAANRESEEGSSYGSGGMSPPTTVQPTPSNSTTTKPSSSTTTPAKPASTSGKGAVSGRGSSGFGSSYGYSGKGGK